MSQPGDIVGAKGRDLVFLRMPALHAVLVMFGRSTMGVSHEFVLFGGSSMCLVHGFSPLVGVAGSLCHMHESDQPAPDCSYQKKVPDSLADGSINAPDANSALVAADRAPERCQLRRQCAREWRTDERSGNWRARRASFATSGRWFWTCLGAWHGERRRDSEGRHCHTAYDVDDHSQHNQRQAPRPIIAEREPVDKEEVEGGGSRRVDAPSPRVDMNRFRNPRHFTLSASDSTSSERSSRSAASPWSDRSIGWEFSQSWCATA